ncbi:MAG: hypothetical protein MZV49_05240 [Rhodopseudomonas palustris]|nr:hypothetical protein [Rhodopseudomonas palustris]
MNGGRGSFFPLGPFDGDEINRLAETGRDGLGGYPILNIGFLPSTLLRLISMSLPLAATCAVRVQYSTGMKASISRSRSMMSFSVTDRRGRPNAI